MENFLPSHLLMLDCEMTGLVPQDHDILQVSALLLKLEETQYTVVRSFNKYLHSKATPTDEFQRKYLSEIMFQCNNSVETAVSVNLALENFLEKHLGTIQPCGDCVSTDLEFLLNKGVIRRNYFKENVAVTGTFNYEVFELNSIKAIARHKIGSKFDKLLPLESGIHNALVDCRNQVQELNAFLKVLL